MTVPNQKDKFSVLTKAVTERSLNCRCGGRPSEPKPIADCENRWIIRCQVKQCYAYNIGQGLTETIQGWNRLSTHFYR